MIVDQQLVTQLGIEEYQPEIIKSLVSNFSAATLALLYISTRGKSPILYPESFQFGVLAVQGISNSLLSHWLRVGQLFDIGPSIIAASVPFREIRQLCTKILEKSADLGQAGPQITLFLQALGRNFTGFSIRASPFTSALLTLILLFATDSRTLLYLYAGAGVDVVIEMAKRAYLWTTGLRAVQGQFAQVTIGEEVVDPIVHDVLHQGNLDPPLTQRITSFERKDLVRYLLWLMTHYVVLLRDGVRLPDGRVVSEETYLLSVKELLQPDPNSRPFPESSLGKILSRRYRPHDAPAAGVAHRDAGAPPSGTWPATVLPQLKCRSNNCLLPEFNRIRTQTGIRQISSTCKEQKKNAGTKIITHADDTRTLADFGLPPVPEEHRAAAAELDEAEELRHLPPIVREEMNFDRGGLHDTVHQRLPALLPAQRQVVDLVLAAVQDQRALALLMDAPGGTGKTFTLNTLLAVVRSRNLVALAVAFSGIAATLLDNGRTFH